MRPISANTTNDSTTVVARIPANRPHRNRTLLTPNARARSDAGDRLDRVGRKAETAA